MLTDVHIELQQLDKAAPAALVETSGSVHIALDPEDMEAAVRALRAVLIERFNSGAWTRTGP